MTHERQNIANALVCAARVPVGMPQKLQYTNNVHGVLGAVDLNLMTIGQPRLQFLQQYVRVYTAAF